MRRGSEQCKIRRFCFVDEVRLDKQFDFIREIDKEKFVCIGQEKLPDTIRYKRGNIFLIILGYVFAVIAGVNGVDGVHDILYNLLGYIYMGLINRIVSVIQILLIYGFYRMSFNYIRSKEYTWNEEGVGVYEHLKYDSFTRVNGLLMLIVFIVAAICRCSMLQW